MFFFFFKCVDIWTLTLWAANPFSHMASKAPVLETGDLYHVWYRTTSTFNIHSQLSSQNEEWDGFSYECHTPVGGRRSRPHPSPGRDGNQNPWLWSSLRTQCPCRWSDKPSHGWRPICRRRSWSTQWSICQRSIVFTPF